MIRFSASISSPQPQFRAVRLDTRRRARISKIMDGENEVDYVETPSSDLKHMSWSFFGPENSIFTNAIVWCRSQVSDNER